MQNRIGADPQKWILKQVKAEIVEFKKPDTERQWPDNWIIATNVDPTATPYVGSFDKARQLVREARPELAKRFHIWGGRKILDFLAQQPDVAAYYAEFISPGHVLTKLYEHLTDYKAQVKDIVRHLVVTQMIEQQFTRLEQAGSNTDNRPGIQRLFTDLPFTVPLNGRKGMAAVCLAQAAAQNHPSFPSLIKSERWKSWALDPARARIWFVKGGPGQGKSTLTQYICQIQRAAIILSEANPKITSTQRQMVGEIKQCASDAGFWPLAPRIPIVVELKEFAQWYGRRDQNESTRILAFLSERLKVGLSQDVPPGMLKRAFESARWLFAFDGLDEVPGDVKDAVAAEVTHFVNDLLIDLQSDALIVCTSRPQGYAGQFNALEAATIELSPLSPAQALACAKPVLEIDRPSAEAKRYYEILSEALESPAVREIMTTPLQSHIMAVVVRDGGRPPERKWQLFANFYQTIKRREANRNLPDRSIANLLRKEDQLLKTLHNRLGFALHVRAETSAHAVTSLDRAELGRIVSDVVSELKSIDVSRTVELVMEATTERLVLVNTPESGEEVRFDIRPLQEFFAAEYLYETGEPEKLADRLRVIAADSHWREVIHFLMSGLIENGRRAELTSAINVLSDLNNGGVDRTGRSLSRRLAIGGIIASRLLREGVLEQDRRVRSQFQECFAPLFGCSDAAALLLSIRSEQSQAWLIESLVSAVTEFAESESVGAIITLAGILPRDHERRPVIQDILLEASIDYRRCLIDSLLPKALEHRELRPQVWVLTVLLKYLIRADWLDLGHERIYSIYRLLSMSGDILELAASDAQIPDVIVRNLRALISVNSHAYDRSAKPLKVERLCGVVEIRCFESGAKVDWRSWDNETQRALASSQGLLHAVYWALRFIDSRTNEDGRSLLACFNDDPGMLRALPECIWLHFSEKAVGTWPQGQEAEFVRLLEQPGKPTRREISFTSRELAPSDWPVLLQRFPRAAYYILFGYGFDVGQREKLERILQELPELAEKICVHIEHSSSELLSYVGGWGYLFALPFIGEKIRSAMLVAAEADVDDDSFGFSSTDFVVRLPSEGVFLPHILNYAASEAEMRRTGGLEETRKSMTQVLGERAGRYIDDFDTLLEVASGELLPARVRAAAAVIALVHPKGVGRSLPFSLETLMEYHHSTDGVWYPRAFAIALTDLIYKEDVAAVNAMSKLIESIRTNYSARLALDEVLRDWREMARAPVESCAGSELWVSS